MKRGNKGGLTVRKWCVKGAVLAFMALGSAVWADNHEDKVVELEDLVVVATGTRLAGEPFDQPYAFNRHEADDLQGQVGRTALDRLNYGPGVFVQRTGPAQASPFIRGLTGEQTLLMLDGIRFSHALMRTGPNQYAAYIPDYSISAIDAILGSSSTVHGSNGHTGALDFRMAPAGRGVDKAISTWAQTRADTGNGVTTTGGLDGINGDWAYSLELGGSWFHEREGGKDFEDHLLGATSGDDIPNSDYDASSTALRLAYLGFTDHLVQLSAGYNRMSEAPRPDGYMENSGKTDRQYRFFDPHEFTYIHLTDSWDIGSDAIERLDTKLWYHGFEETEFRSRIRDQGDLANQRIAQTQKDDALDVFGVDLQATTLLGDEEQHELTWGVTYIYENTDMRYEEYRTPKGSLDLSLLAPHDPADWNNKTTVSDDAEYETLGIFLQDDWHLTDTISLLAGIRYSDYQWEFGDVDGDADNFTGGLRGMWMPVENHRVFGGISRGFRAPNLTDLDGLVDRSSSGAPAAGNPDLDPEISLTYEVGWKWGEGRNFVSATVFHTEIDDYIQPDYSIGGVETNAEQAELYGFELVWDYGVEVAGDDRIALVGSMSLVDGTVDIPLAGGGSFEDNISRANRLYGNFGLKYERGKNWWAKLQIRWHDTYDDIATHPGDSDSHDVRLTTGGNPDGSMPGYGVVDLLIGWRSDDAARHVNLFVENIGDKTYREPGSALDGVGLNVGVTAGIRF
jgi:hemoglobin/transferrin/lactoferrin receptor protein